ncbi:patatin-like phospholipase family protein [Actinoplanes sp. TFC3]|uniref:patatin-like phospholipase family protein n=1 Tax=Actinoplanes sp. TFC3 TaxID=1710355 RepID=UPI00082979F6|nr:patatin-like phospholipase family protein [Actinoplanes sp. TFC3]
MKALILGGGGITGIVWELGLLAGLRRLGIELGEADLIVGTSAGAFVGALLATGADLDEAIATAAEIEIELSPRIDPGLMAEGFSLLTAGNLSPTQLRARLGTLARRAPVGDEGPHIARFADHLPVHTWPASPRLVVTTVDTETGERVAWDASAQVPLPSAVAASCALPGVFPPVHLAGSYHMDGGVHAVVNADLAAGADAAIVLAPSGGGMLRATPQAELAELNAPRSLLLTPDSTARAALGGNVLDPGRRAHGLAAGIEQAKAVAESVKATWS